MSVMRVCALVSMAWYLLMKQQDRASGAHGPQYGQRWPCFALQPVLQSQSRKPAHVQAHASRRCRGACRWPPERPSGHVLVHRIGVCARPARHEGLVERAEPIGCKRLVSRSVRHASDPYRGALSLSVARRREAHGLRRHNGARAAILLAARGEGAVCTIARVAACRVEARAVGGLGEVGGYCRWRRRARCRRRCFSRSRWGATRGRWR